MQAVTTIGLDIAKSVFQVHGADAADQGVHPPPVKTSPGPWRSWRSCKADLAQSLADVAFWTPTRTSTLGGLP